MQARPLEIKAMRRTIDALLASSAPCQTCSSLTTRAHDPDATPFERYAGLVLRDAGAVEVASDLASLGFRLTPPRDGHLARFTLPKKASPSEHLGVKPLEDAVNRLITMVDCLEEAERASATELLSPRYYISYLGTVKPPAQTATPLGVGKLNALASGQLDVSDLCELDWQLLDAVADQGHALFQNCLRPNKRQTILGIAAPSSGEWDMRTRMAAMLERLQLSLRFEYRFDCDARALTSAISFTPPDEAGFPKRLASCGLENTIDRGQVEEACRVYAVRLACLLACICFGSGRHVKNAFVHGVDAGGNPLFSCAFERDRFVRSTLASLDDKELSAAALRFDSEAAWEIANPLALTRAVRPTRHAAASGKSPAPKRNAHVLEGAEGSLQVGKSVTEEPFWARHNPARIEPSEDGRLLPADFAQLFGAKRVRDMSTQGSFGDGLEVIEEAKVDSSKSIMSAIAYLETEIDLLEAQTAPPDDDGSARPLYCANAFSRIAMPLIADDLSVSSQAETFLHGEIAVSADQSDGARETRIMPRFFRAPDALFHAHMGLSDLYQRLDSFGNSIAHADRCIALAPTTASAYFRKSDVLAAQERYAEAANVLLDGLRCAVARRDCALLYYHLALILWRLGRDNDAAACQVYAASLEGEFAEKAWRVVESLRKRKGSAVIVHASPLAAAREMVRSRIPVMPSDEARALVAKAAIGLVEAGAPSAAAPYAHLLASYFPDDAIIARACASICSGAEPAYSES